MEIIILIGVCLIGFMMVRAIIGSVTIIIWGKSGGIENVKPIMRVINLLETIVCVIAYIILVNNYYWPIQ